MPVTIGLFHALRSAHGGLGFFTPIEVTSFPNSPSKFQVIKDVFKLQDSDESMQGVTHTQAFKLIDCNKMDELLEEVLKGTSSIDSKRAYEAYKAKHDFIVVEGASLKRAGDDATVLNTKIASTLGLPVLMVINRCKEPSGCWRAEDSKVG
ncbi:hypothetical protein L7F22_024721 [Adiantum nelumboides]|nr:hypothetical protein [Adiantum nelumboides]